MTVISSKDNKQIKDLIKIRDDSKFRNDKSLFYIEGERLFKDTPKNLIHSIFIKSSLKGYYSALLSEYNSDTINIVDDNIYNLIKDTVNSQGIIALVNYNIVKNFADIPINMFNNIIILDSVNDPGNLGTIIRLSESANIDLLILANNCCNLYNPKVIRASMSSIFRSKIYLSENINADIKYLKESNFNIYATKISDNATSYFDIDFKSKNVVIYGNEANGISKELLELTDRYIKIPMFGNIESLNVAISVSIITYEIVRQNLIYETKS